jgi:hypothetical protein
LLHAAVGRGVEFGWLLPPGPSRRRAILVGGLAGVLVGGWDGVVGRMVAESDGREPVGTRGSHTRTPSTNVK